MTKDEAYGILGNCRRRKLIHLLASADEGLPVSTVAQHIAETATGDDRSAEDRYRPIYVSLQQHHIPKLVDFEVIRYDEEAKRVAPGHNFEELARYVDDASLDRYTVVPPLLSGAGMVFVVLIALGPPVVGSIDVRWPLFACLLAIFVTSLYSARPHLSR
ncbi:DUF7344 domain-containing protein [Halomarina litorea]|uniref:DUF7344 domain-containing protein n=1 Tax=Halomarina litorea TaxID=2961595 RepID=UPI0020C51BB7|nr:hypothetical protein [Halomarina sp. BCD28]